MQVVLCFWPEWHERLQKIKTVCSQSHGTVLKCCFWRADGPSQLAPGETYSIPTEAGCKPTFLLNENHSTLTLGAHLISTSCLFLHQKYSSLESSMPREHPSLKNTPPDGESKLPFLDTTVPCPLSRGSYTVINWSDSKKLCRVQPCK